MRKIYLCQAFMHLWVQQSAEAFKYEEYDISIVLGFFGTPWMWIRLLGTGHKVTARVGLSDLGWAMENLWPVSIGRQVFCMSTVGPCI
jgi:hypothetical protein